MKLQHFVISDSQELKDKALSFLSLKKACEKEGSPGNAANFRRAGLSMGRAYLALSQSLGVGSGLFPVDNGSRSCPMSIECLKGEIVIRAPEGIKFKQAVGLEVITADDYINLRENARRALSAKNHHALPRFNH